MTKYKVKTQLLAFGKTFNIDDIVFIKKINENKYNVFDINNVLQGSICDYYFDIVTRDFIVND